MPRPASRQVGRMLTGTIGLSALVLTSLTTASATPQPVPAAEPAAVSTSALRHSSDEGHCDPIRFGPTEVAAAPATATDATAESSSRQSFPVHIDLPANFQPEGIAINQATAYFGSRVDGDIYAADLRTGTGRVISEGPGTASLGMKVDQYSRLFVAVRPVATAG